MSESGKAELIQALLNSSPPKVMSNICPNSDKLRKKNKENGQASSPIGLGGQSNVPSKPVGKVKHIVAADHVASNFKVEIPPIDVELYLDLEKTWLVKIKDGIGENTQTEFPIR